jgi:DNA-binding MarR family transcriptional regulator
MLQPSDKVNPADRVNSAHIGFDFFTNHAHVLFLIARDRDLRMREMAAEIGITERAVQRIVEELTTYGYLKVTKDGRRNRYEVVGTLPLRHHVESHMNVEQLVHCLFPQAS